MEKRKIFLAIALILSATMIITALTRDEEIKTISDYPIKKIDKVAIVEIESQKSPDKIEEKFVLPIKKIMMNNTTKQIEILVKNILIPTITDES